MILPRQPNSSSGAAAALVISFLPSKRRKMMRRRVPWIVLTLVMTVFVHGQTTSKQIKFTDTTLDNGLRVILSEDHHAPTYSISVTYNVGSRDERKGRTGFAHLFEHMMFQGSENVGKGE